MTVTVNRQIYGRLFNGAMDSIADAATGSMIGALYDKLLMPALSVGYGDALFYEFELDEDESATITLPEDYGVTDQLYIAVEANLSAYIEYNTPDISGNLISLYGTDDPIQGTHKAFWSFQGIISSVVISVPPTVDGGSLTQFKVFLYKIPDLADYESYADKQIGFGVSGDE
jgi:hypothetical protein